ncbi:hypothetical protein Avbf_12239 [Armadillidium vulgare]|nr:hypothetical protein Avbf_12239 [Armadillidium vulgare]
MNLEAKLKLSIYCYKDLTNFIVAVINYPIAISAMEVKYKDNEELYYTHHSSGSQGPRIEKISRYRRKLLNESEDQDYFMDNETIKEQIENITEALVDKTINFFGDLFSSISSKISTSSEIINTSLNEFSEKKIETSHEPSSQLVEDLYKGRNIKSCREPTKLDDYYYIYVTLSLTVPSIICIIIQGFVFITLLWIECVKYRIWKATPEQQPPIEITLNDLEENTH